MIPLSASPLSAAERLAWLCLIRTENVGPVTFFQLVQRFGSASAALAALPLLARKGGRQKPLIPCLPLTAEQELTTALRLAQRAVCWVEPDYPALLRTLEDAPPVIYMQGRRDLIHPQAVAIVGSRNASLGGRNMALLLAGQLGQAGCVVVSGLARGIDTAAHEGALATGTIAVVAGGADYAYPPENARLHAMIAKQGLIVAEHPPGTVPQARHFPRRNRIISGMAEGVVVVEATKGSGSLITARLAAEQGREVFAVPGSPLDPRAAGGNGLLKEGACLIESAHDVLAVLRAHPPAAALFERATPPLAGSPPSLDEADLVRWRRTVTDLLSPSPVSIDEIIRAASAPPAAVQTVLLELQLAGRLERHPGGRVSRVY
jgi:DNA processing protein